MDFFEESDADQKNSDDFIDHVCRSLSIDKHELRTQFCTACIEGNTESKIRQTLLKIFSYDCLSSDRFRMKKAKMTMLTNFFEFLIAGDPGIQALARKLKEYDYSARCSLVWTSNYFAYRCRTCGISPSMSLCSSCFNSGNHSGHDFNKFKSLAGGACDCGDSTVMKPSGYCRYHGPDKVHNRPTPPEDLVAPLRCLLPHFLPALLFWFWELCSTADPTALTDEVAPALYVLHVLHACGWVTQKLIADVLIDENVFTNLKNSCTEESAYQNYLLSVATNPCFGMPRIIGKQDLVHRHLLDAFIFCTIKLRFPEALVTFLIGLLTVEDFKEEFVQSYLNHYTRVASTVIISTRARMLTDWTLQMNNRIVHISVQLFSGESLALRMVRERHLHYLLVHCLLNMCEWCRARLDTRSNMVVDCDGPLIHNNVFWPFVSDLSNLVSHKSIVDVFVEDAEFLESWTAILKYMQFMNCYVLREGDHIEYETNACYYAFTMEIEISANAMWNIWQHYLLPSEKAHCLAYATACLSTLRKLLKNLGRIVCPRTQGSHSRSPLSLHLPLMRHASCFMSLAIMNHNARPKDLLADFLSPNPYLLWRFMDELANTLLGCHEVMIGYWVRNGQALRQSIMYYMQSQFCYSFIDLDIFAMQLCASLLPPVYVLNSLLNPTRLLREIQHYEELLTLVAPASPRNLDRKPLALESWLTNLCWILDLRNNICLSEDELLKKELICVLAPESRKRSHLANLLPEKCGINGQGKNLDEVLDKVATYTAPTCDEVSGNLVSGQYYLRPSLWHTEFDPVFHSLRVTSRRELATTLEKYRDHLRQRHGLQASTTIWPPYRSPKPLPADLVGLDYILQSRHLHFLFFIQLSLYVYGDPLVTEESLAIIIHLLNRALDASCPGTSERENEVITESTTNEPMEVDSTAVVSEPLTTYHSGFDEDPAADTFFGRIYFNENGETEPEIVPDEPSESPRDHHTATSGRPKASPVEHPEDFSWDSSLANCPYPPQSNLLDNLGRWLMVEHYPKPHASLSPTVLATLDNSQHPRDSMTGSIPSISMDPLEIITPCILVDNLLTLLVKAHARLYWSRTSGTLDTLPKVLAGKSFVDPNTVDLDGLSAEPTIEMESVTEQEQANNTDDEPNPKTSNRPKLFPRSSAVLPNHHGLPSADVLFGTSNNMASGKIGSDHHDDPSRPRNSLTCLAPELRYFAAGPPAYVFPEERSSRNPEDSDLIRSCSDTDNTPCPDPSDSCSDPKSNESIAFGDGASYVQRLLDKICSRSPECQSALRMYVARARRPFDSMLRPFNSQAVDSSTAVGEKLSNAKEARALPIATDSPIPDRYHLANVPLDDGNIGSVPPNLTAPAPGAGNISREERKKAAMERRKRLMEQMVSKQKAFAMAHLDDIDLQDQSTVESAKSPEPTYECVICQTSDTAASAEMILLDMMCESGVSLNIRETSAIPRLVGRQPTQACGVFADPAPRQDPSFLLPLRPPDSNGDDTSSPSVFPVDMAPASSSCQAPSGTVGVSVLASGFDSSVPGPTIVPSAATPQSPSVPPSPSPNSYLSSGPSAMGYPPTANAHTPACYLESRRWWSVALPNTLAKCLPLLRPGLILQTCGHAVHKECFQRYRSQGGTRTARNRPLVSCPLCRREVHHLLPLVPLSWRDKEVSLSSRPPVEHIRWLETVLASLETEGQSVWTDLNGSEDEAIMQRRILMSQLLGERFEATVLLRSQLECELSVLMSCPSQYSMVSRRCAWREFLLYCRRLYKRSSDLQYLLQCLTNDLAPALEECDSNLPSTLVFALCQDPGDILLSLLPHIWPHEDSFLVLVSGLYCLAYIRALISALLNAPFTRSIFTTSSSPFDAIVDKLNDPIRAHVKTLIPLIESLPASLLPKDLSEPPCEEQTPMDNRILLAKASALPDCGETHPLQFNQDQFELHVVNRILPFLRLAGLCRARWVPHTEEPSHECLKLPKLVPTGLPFVGQLIDKFAAPKHPDPTDSNTSVLHNPHVEPEQRYFEFSDLCRILSLDCGETAIIRAAQVADWAATRSGLACDAADALNFLSQRWFEQLRRTSISPTSANADVPDGVPSVDTWIENLAPLVEIGRQLYPPRLLRTPYAFDVLFNALHVTSCDTVQHRFQENALCLICGRLICTLCTSLPTAMVEHAYSCEGFTGVVLEINTSIVHVSLGPTVCDWGSIYLDAYGEEDLELKRGKPLYLNGERFALLENQWLSHSFRHVLKQWRVL